MILFADSVDHYATAHIRRKYTAVVDPGLVLSVAQGTGRGGTNALRFTWSVVGSGSQSTPSYALFTCGAQTTLIAGIALQVSALPGAQRQRCLLSFVDGASEQVNFFLNSSGSISAYRAGSSTALGTTSVAALTINTFYYLQFKTTFHDTTGVLGIRVSKDQRLLEELTLTAQNTRSTSNNYATGFTLGQFTTGGGNALDGVGPASNHDYDDIILCNTLGTDNTDFLGDVRVQYLPATSAGAVTEFGVVGESSNVRAVDETEPNADLDYVTSDVVGETDTYVHAPLVGSGRVKGAQVLLYAKQFPVPVRSLSTVVRHGSTVYAGLLQNPGYTYTYMRQIYERNPGTGALWTTAEIDAAQIGEQISSEALPPGVISNRASMRAASNAQARSVRGAAAGSGAAQFSGQISNASVPPGIFNNEVSTLAALISQWQSQGSQPSAYAGFFPISTDFF